MAISRLFFSMQLAIAVLQGNVVLGGSSKTNSKRQRAQGPLPFLARDTAPEVRLRTQLQQTPYSQAARTPEWNIALLELGGDTEDTNVAFSKRIEEGEKEEALDPSEKVLFVTYSDSKFYDTRIKWVLSTWAKDLNRSEFLIVSDKEPKTDIGARVRGTSCQAHTHDGACCKVAEAMLIANEEMQRDPNLKWVYFSDDDVYLRPDQMRKALAGQQASDGNSNGIVLGTFGCVYKPPGGAQCAGGLCGGAGLAVSRQAAGRLAAGKDGKGGQSFKEEVMQFCGKCGFWGDISISSTFAEMGIETRPLQGLHMLQSSKACFDRDISDSRPFEPLEFHYMKTEQQMQLMHRIFNPSGATSSASSGSSSLCATYRGVTQCAASAAEQDKPWGLSSNDGC